MKKLLIASLVLSTFSAAQAATLTCYVGHLTWDGDVKEKDVVMSKVVVEKEARIEIMKTRSGRTISASLYSDAEKDFEIISIRSDYGIDTLSSGGMLTKSASLNHNDDVNKEMITVDCTILDSDVTDLP